MINLELRYVTMLRVPMFELRITGLAPQERAIVHRRFVGERGEEIAQMDEYVRTRYPQLYERFVEMVKENNIWRELA